MKTRPKSVVLDLLSNLKGRSAPVKFLVAAAEIFGIDSNATRVAITRLLACGLIERDERGAYRTGAAALPILKRLDSWRSIEKRTRKWDGSWIGATPDACCCAREARSSTVHALEFTGLREFSGGLWIRPDNLDGGIEATRETFKALRVPPTCPIFRICEFDDDGQGRASALWDAAAIQGLYRTLARELEASAERLPQMEEKAAMSESFLLGGEAIRRIVLDPLLPDAIVPTAARDALVRSMTRYDEIGRRCWTPFLQRYGVLASDSPIDRQQWRETTSDFLIPTGEVA